MPNSHSSTRPQPLNPYEFGAIHRADQLTSLRSSLRISAVKTPSADGYQQARAVLVRTRGARPEGALRRRNLSPPKRSRWDWTMGPTQTFSDKILARESALKTHSPATPTSQMLGCQRSVFVDRENTVACVESHPVAHEEVVIAKHAKLLLEIG